MEADKVDKFLLANESKFPDYEIPIHKLLNLPPEKETLLEDTHFRSPGKILLHFPRCDRFGPFPDREHRQRLWQTSDRRRPRDMVYCRLVPDHRGDQAI